MLLRILRTRLAEVKAKQTDALKVVKEAEVARNDAARILETADTRLYLARVELETWERELSSLQGQVTNMERPTGASARMGTT